MIRWASSRESVSITLQYINVSNSHAVHLKVTRMLYAKYISIKKAEIYGSKDGKV